MILIILLVIYERWKEDSKMEIRGFDQNGQFNSINTIKRSNKTCLLTSEPVEKVLFDDTEDYTYVGYAPRSTATSAASWLIKRIDASTGDITYASADYDQVWDNRATIATYA